MFFVVMVFIFSVGGKTNLVVMFIKKQHALIVITTYLHWCYHHLFHEQGFKIGQIFPRTSNFISV